MKHVSATNQKHVIEQTSNKKTVLWTKQKKIYNLFATSEPPKYSNSPFKKKKLLHILYIA